MNPIKSMSKLAAAALVLGLTFISKPAVAATPYVMSTGDYLEDFSDIANWGNGFASGIGAAPWSANDVNSSGTIPDGVKITKSTLTFASGTSGGVQKGTENLILLNTGSSDNTASCAIDLNLDFTARNAGTLSFDWAETNNSTGDRASSLRVYTSTDGTTWTELTEAAVLNVANNVAASGSITTVPLPVEFTGSATARIRFYEYNGVGGTGGSRAKIAIDNVAVTSTGASGAPPTITGISPASIDAIAGDTDTVTVSFTGDAPTYFWYKETASSTNLIAGATTATLTLADVLAADAANYQVVLTNASGSATSDVVTVTVVDPAITSQPTSQTRLVNGDVSFAVSANGTQPLAYQWFTKTTSDDFDFSGMSPVSNGGRISGADTNVLTITSLTDADATNFFVVVSGSAGSVTSSVVTLTVASSASLAYWNFNGDLNITNPVTFLGVGTALAINCSGFSNNISSGLDYDFSSTPNGWGTSTYPALDASNKTAGVRFNVSTAGAKNIAISYDTRATSTASKYARLQYTTNGVDFIDYPTSYSFVQSANYESRAFSLAGFPGVADNTNFAVRIVTEFESTASYGVSNDDQYVGNGSTYASSGTVSYDIVNITGDAITNNNTRPTITAFTNVITTDTSGATVLHFTVGDAETAAGSLAVTAVSSNQTVMPDYNLALGGSGASRTLTLTPTGGALGVAPILVTVTDGNGDSTVTWFYVTVEPGNQPPTISGLDTTNMLGNATKTFDFTVGDDNTPAGSLTVSAISGNSTLVPNDVSHIALGGSGANRTISITPATDQYGTASVTVTVDDGEKNTPVSFIVVVRPNTATVMDEGFDYDASGAIINVSAGFWAKHSGTAGQMQAGAGVVTVTDGNSEDVNAPLIDSPYNKANASALYASFTLNFSALPTADNVYFAHFKDATTSGFYGRIYATTTGAADGSYRIGIGNASTTSGPAQIPQDLSPGVNYTIVTRLVLSNGVSTIWIDPTNEASSNATDTTSASAPSPITSYALRESAGEGTLTIDNLKVGLNFLSVISNIVDVPPQANPDSYSVVGHSVDNVFSPLTNDVLNMPQGSLSIFSVSPTNGTATISGPNILFTPTPGFAGTTTIGYTITDGFGGLSSSLITAAVSNVSPTPEPITVQTAAGQLVMSWTQSTFSLAASTNVAGPYVKIPEAASPYTNSTGADAMFFRLVYP